MAEKVLVPLDRSEQAKNALEWALEEFGDAHLTLLHVIEPLNMRYVEEAQKEAGEELTPEKSYEKVVEDTEAFLSRYVRKAEESGVEASYDHTEGKPPRGIVEYAEEHDVDHIVMGSHGRTGVSRVLLGSVAEKVARRSPAPVTVVR
jgi:nucleotide-binding universal stress UspA family protein